MSRLARHAARLLRAAPLAELAAPRSAAAWAVGPAGEARAWRAVAPWACAAPRGFAAAAGGSGDVSGDDDEEAADSKAARAEAEARREELAMTRALQMLQQGKRGDGGGQRAPGKGSEDAWDEEDDEHAAGLPPQGKSLLQRLEGMSRKQQQFALAQELMGRGEVTREVATKVFLRAQALAEQSPEGLEGLAGQMQAWEHAASQEEKADPLRPADRTLEMHVVNINRTVKVTKSGSLQRFTALVVVGNRAGAVGWALGKAPEVPAAVDKAYTRAARHLFYFPRYQEHTIFHGARAKFGATHVTIDPLPSGMGLKANTTIQAVCRLAGIRDIRAKVVGSHNPHTTLRAVFEALDSVRTPAEVAAARGRAVLETVPRNKQPRKQREAPRSS